MRIPDTRRDVNSAHALTLPHGFERHAEVGGGAAPGLAPRQIQPDEIDKRHEQAQADAVAVQGGGGVQVALVVPGPAKIGEPATCSPA